MVIALHENPWRLRYPPPPASIGGSRNLPWLNRPWANKCWLRRSMCERHRRTLGMARIGLRNHARGHGKAAGPALPSPGAAGIGPYRQYRLDGEVGDVAKRSPLRY